MPWLKMLLGGVALGVLVLAGLAWGMRGDGCASLLFQLSYHGTGRTDAQAVPPCQAGLQRMSRSGGVVAEAAL